MTIHSYPAMAFANISKSFLFFIFFILNIINADKIDDKYGLGIINGHPINITEVPFMAIYRPKGITWGCGASIVHEQFLVTACHCIRIFFGHKAEVVVATDNVHKGEKYEIEKAICHPNYNNAAIDYDIGVLKLKLKLTLSERVNIVKMADSSIVPKKGDMFKAIGFGLTETHKPSEILLAVDISFVDRDECQRNLTRAPKVTDRMFCAGGGSPYHGGCSGDSGGASLLNGLLTGVHSWGKPFSPNVPEVFAYVSSMRDFIDKTIARNI